MNELNRHVTETIEPLANAYSLIRDRNLTTGERWELVICTGIYTEAWVLNINNGNKWFSAAGILSEALQSAIEQWEHYCELIGSR